MALAHIVILCSQLTFFSVMQMFIYVAQSIYTAFFCLLISFVSVVVVLVCQLALCVCVGIRPCA